MDIDEALLDDGVIESDFGDVMNFMKNNGSYLDLCWLKNHWRVHWIVEQKGYIENDENIFKAVAKVVKKVRDDFLLGS